MVHIFKKAIVSSRIEGIIRNIEEVLVEAFIEAGILKETAGYQINRVFIFEEYVRMFR